MRILALNILAARSVKYVAFVGNNNLLLRNNTGGIAMWIAKTSVSALRGLQQERASQ